MAYDAVEFPNTGEWQEDTGNWQDDTGSHQHQSLTESYDASGFGRAVLDAGDPDYHDRIDDGFAIPTGDYDGPDTGGIFGSIGSAFRSIGRAVGSVARTVARPIGSVVSAYTNLVQKGLKALTNNPLWDIARTGVSFIPGVGQAVSAGMAGAAAVGRGEALANIGLAAARGAIPGGILTQAAFDIALGLAKGKNVTDSILAAARSQVPGGELGKAAFDAATAIAKGQNLSSVALASIRSKVPGGAQGQAAFDAAIAASKGGPKAAITHFPGISGIQNVVARSILSTPALRLMPARDIAARMRTSVQNVQRPMAAIMNRWKGAPIFNTGDVGAIDSLDDCCRREGVPMPSDTGEDDTGAPYSYWDLAGPMVPKVRRVQMHPAMLQGMLRYGPSAVRQGILAHGLVPRLYRQTGELDQSGGWIIRSGESPSGIAAKLTGSGTRWREILAVNPGLKVVTKGTTTLVQPFNPGQRITIPASWLGTAVRPSPAAPAPTLQPPAPREASTPAARPAAPAGPGVTLTTTFPPPSAAATMPVVQQGSSNKSGVALWQSALFKLGSQIIKSPSDVDGAFGPLTKQATTGYQLRMGLAADGIVGPITWRAALSEMAAKGVAVAPPAPPPPVSAPPLVTLPPAPPTLGNLAQTAAIQASLGYFYQNHDSEITGAPSPTFGSIPEDLAGTWSNRSTQAMRGFQVWRNSRPVAGMTPLSTSGEADQPSVNALQAQNALDLRRVGIDVVNVPPPIPGSAPPAPPPIFTPPALPPVPGAPPTGPPVVRKAGGDGGIAILLLLGLALAASGGRRAA